MRVRLPKRFWAFVFVAGPVLAAATAPSPPDVRARSTIPAIALIPQNTWPDAGEPPPPGLEPTALYVFRPDRLAGTRVGLEAPGTLRNAGLSPVGDLLALAVTHGGNGTPGDSSASGFRVVVADTSGDTSDSLAGAVRFSWRPDGTELAVGIASAPWAPTPAIDSVLIWDPRSHFVRGYRVSASRGALGWDGGDVVLVGGPVTGSVAGQATALNVRTGAIRRAKHRGTSLSPDRLYSIGPSGGALRWGIYDATGADLAARAVKLLRLSTVDRTQAAWVAYPGAGHLACVSACGPWVGPEAGPRHRTCRTGLVDVKLMRLLGWTEGRLIGPTSEGEQAVVYQGGALRFLTRADWKAGPAPLDSSGASARAH
jgi:hypothetical protein